jgi:hypothetical protein
MSLRSHKKEREAGIELIVPLQEGTCLYKKGRKTRILYK